MRGDTRGTPNRSNIFTPRLLVAVLLCFSVCAASRPAQAQSTPLDSIAAAIEVAIIGTVVVVGVVVYIAIPKQKTIEGCITSGDDGLQLTAHNHNYALLTADLNLQAGHRVVLKGKPGKRHAAARDFAVRKLVKDEGACSSH